MARGKPVNRIAAAVIVIIWSFLAALGVGAMMIFI